MILNLSVYQMAVKNRGQVPIKSLFGPPLEHSQTLKSRCFKPFLPIKSVSRPIDTCASSSQINSI